MEDHIPWPQLLHGDDVVLTAPGSPEWRLPLVLFTAQGLANTMEAAGLQVETMATANPLVPQAAAALLELELAICDRPSLLDSGEHLIAAGGRAL